MKDVWHFGHFTVLPSKFSGKRSLVPQDAHLICSDIVNSPLNRDQSQWSACKISTKALLNVGSVDDDQGPNPKRQAQQAAKAAGQHGKDGSGHGQSVTLQLLHLDRAQDYDWLKKNSNAVKREADYRSNHIPLRELLTLWTRRCWCGTHFHLHHPKDNLADIDRNAQAGEHDQTD
jgi:hypothetical protein